MIKSFVFNLLVWLGFVRGIKKLPAIGQENENTEQRKRVTKLLLGSETRNVKGIDLNAKRSLRLKKNSIRKRKIMNTARSMAAGTASR